MLKLVQRYKPKLMNTICKVLKVYENKQKKEIKEQLHIGHFIFWPCKKFYFKIKNLISILALLFPPEIDQNHIKAQTIMCLYKHLIDPWTL